MPPKIIIDENRLKEAWDRLHNLTKIAKEFGFSRPAIKARLMELGVEFPIKHCKKMPILILEGGHKAKQCTICNLIKSLSSFRFRNDHNSYRNECIECLKIIDKNYHLKNKDKRNASSRKYQQENKIIVNKQKRKWTNEQYKNDIIFKLRALASGAIYKTLKRKNISKNGESILKYLPYLIEDLKIHIEALFSHTDNLTQDGKVWMTWNNWGVYDPKTWNDNDPSTWTWQLDHIRPHSTFYYETMDCEEFRKCWALENLRPLSAKQNLLDGNRR